MEHIDFCCVLRASPGWSCPIYTFNVPLKVRMASCGTTLPGPHMCVYNPMSETTFLGHIISSMWRNSPIYRIFPSHADSEGLTSVTFLWLQRNRHILSFPFFLFLVYFSSFLIHPIRTSDPLSFSLPCCLLFSIQARIEDGWDSCHSEMASGERGRLTGRVSSYLFFLESGLYEPVGSAQRSVPPRFALSQYAVLTQRTLMQKHIEKFTSQCYRCGCHDNMMSSPTFSVW